MSSEDVTEARRRQMSFFLFKMKANVLLKDSNTLLI